MMKSTQCQTIFYNSIAAFLLISFEAVTCPAHFNKQAGDGWR